MSWVESALSRARSNPRASRSGFSSSKSQRARLALADVRPEASVLDEERKLVTHAIRMSTYNAESALARMLAPHFRLDEARALLREAFNSAGDLEVVKGTVNVRIDPLSAPRRSRALAALCDELNDAQARYPGTDLVLHFSVKDLPGIP